MMTHFRRLAARLRGFGRDERGSITLEVIIVMPILFWSLAACFVFFDGYRQSSVNLKAAYTLGDLLSRETGTVDDTYIDSMSSLLQELTGSRSTTNLRVTVIRYDAEDDRYYVDWSANRGYPETLTDANVVEIKDRLPTMPDDERVILVETDNLFEPAIKVGLDPVHLENFIFTRPRFAPQLCGFDMACSG